MTIGNRVITPHGGGVIVDKETYSKAEFNRYGVKLDNNPFPIPVAYYFIKELTPSK